MTLPVGPTWAITKNNTRFSFDLPIKKQKTAINI